MKTIKTPKILIVLFLLNIAFVNAQTADEIIQNYLENTGGADNWKNVKSLKIVAKAYQGGNEIPAEVTQVADGRQITQFQLQGQTFVQNAFDGEVVWNTNMQSMKAEKSPQEEADNMKREAASFPDPFIDYKEKGYTVEYMGTEEYEGSETYKIKLTKLPMLVDGKEEANVTYYFFDMDNYVPLATQSEIKSGAAKGMMSETTFSDYQKVEGLYFPFAMTQGLKGQPGMSITIEKYVLNPEVDDKVFMFPEEEASVTPDKKN